MQKDVFPSEQVRLYINKNSNMIYGIEPIGKSIPAKYILPPFSSEQYASEFMVEDGKAYKGSMEEIISKLGFSAQQHATPDARNSGARR